MNKKADSVFDFAAVAKKLGLLDGVSVEQLRSEPIATNEDQKRHAIKNSLIRIQDAEVVDSVLQPIDAIPGFRLTHLLGRGGMGVVYQATQVNLGRSVALKTILMEKVGGTAIGRFEREARTLAKIQHPNIISIYDFGRQNDQFYFAMEFIDGEDVADFVKRTGGLSEPISWGIIRQVVAGLAHAAKEGIVHRDIKPANVLLLQPPEGTAIPGGAPLAKVADFGLAIEERDLGDGSTRFTEERMIVGSPSYMSPEQFDSATVDFRSDIYSCGATVYEMVTGLKPFAGLSIAKLMSAKVNGELPLPISEIDASSDTKRVISKMMSVERTDRFDSYDALLSAIDRCLQERGDTGVSLGKLNSIDRPETRADYVVDEATFNEQFEPTAQLLAKNQPSSRGVFAAIVCFAVILLTLVAWILVEKFTYRPGSRDLIALESLPLYQGQDISGWPINQQSGQVGTEPDELKSMALFVQNGYCRRLLPETSWKNYSLTFAIWIPGDATAELHFGVSNHSKQFGVLELTNTNSRLLTRDSNGVERVNSVADIQLVENNYTMINIEKQQSDWFVFIDDQFFAAMPFIAEDDAMEIRLVAKNGKVRFIELNQRKLGPKN